MFRSRTQDKRKRPYRVKKTGIKDENIDRQILVIHKAIGLKLLAQYQRGDLELIDTLKSRLESRRDEGRMGYGEFLTWYSLLEIIDDEQAFMSEITLDSTRMRKLRRRTPFVGVLTEEERQAALNQEAIGTIDSVSVLL
jgi:hypothetical protein